MQHLPLALELEGPSPILRRLAHRVHVARATQVTLETLNSYDLIERQDVMARSASKHTLGICAGVCVAVFPFAPVMIQDCTPISKAGWICAARMSAFIAACGEAAVGLHCVWSLYRSRGFRAQQAARLALDLSSKLPDADRCGLGADVLRTYRAQDERGRDYLRSFLCENPMPV